MKIGVLLSGCGVYDGAEIQESVLAMLAIEENGHEAVSISVDKNQHHVVNHLTGEEMNETRNMMVESARIARGNVKNINDITPAEIDAIVIPGGFGSAKNFTNWAFEGPDGDIIPEIKLLLVNMINIGKPVVGLCVSPVVLAKALEGSEYHPLVTIGTSEEATPYDIQGFRTGLEKTGLKTEATGLKGVTIDQELKIITAPCYMQDASVLEIRNNIKLAIDALNEML